VTDFDAVPEMLAAIDFAGLADRVRTATPRCGDVRVVAIDGGAASGKTTVAAALATELGATPILHCDDLLDGWAGQFTFWPRLRSILATLATGGAASYQRYDWVAGHFADEITVEPHGTLIVEGLSSIVGCAGAAACAIFVDVARPVRERRWAARDGAPLQPEWITWLDAEDRFFAAHPPHADVVLTL
jgi:hypothetical protein